MHPYGVSVISPHFGPQDPYAYIVMTKLHPPIFQPYITPFSAGTDFDLSMMMPVYTVELDPSEATPLHVIRLDFEATSSTRGSRVSGRKRGQGRGDGLRLKLVDGEMGTFSLRLRGLVVVGGWGYFFLHA